MNKLIFAALFIISCASHAAFVPGAPREDAWVTDGDVYSVVSAGDRVYIGGRFFHLFPHTGAGIPLVRDTGAAQAQFPKVNGVVLSSVSDGLGGWYIGGAFTRVGDKERNNIARIMSDGSVASWDPGAYPPVQTSLAVRTLLLDSSKGVLYVGGAFTNIGGSARNNIAALSVETGSATDWNPDADNIVEALAFSEVADIVFAGGSFSGIGSSNRNYIAALDASSGHALAWRPEVNRDVYALALHDSDLYIGGRFWEVNGEGRVYLTALHAETGALTGWEPDTLSAGNVYDIAVSPDGQTVYVGGAFSRVAAIDAVTADKIWYPVASWRQEPSAAGTIRALALSPDGNTLYVGGEFTLIGESNRHYLAAFDTSSREILDWNPAVNDNVWTLAVHGNSIYAGGWFSGAGAGAPRSNIAALDSDTGIPVEWSPQIGDIVNAIAVSPDGGKVYAGGAFTNIENKARNHIAAFSASTGNLYDWNPNVNSQVYSMALSPDGDTLYIGGSFTNIGGLGGDARNHIAALATGSDNVLSWDPDADRYLWGNMTFSPDGTLLYVTGAFSNIGGRARSQVAALRVSDGGATDWNPDPGARVYRVDVSPDGGRVYAAGAFRSIGGQSRNRIAALDAETGVAVPGWAPNADDSVYALAASPDGKNVYAGGWFTGGMAALDAETGRALGWDIESNGCWAFAVSENSSNLYAVGGFSIINGMRRRGFAMFNVDYVPGPADNALPVYRFYSAGAPESTYTHLWTINGAERDALMTYPSWQYEGIGWYALPGEEPGATQLYRLYEPNIRRHLYTTNVVEYSVLTETSWNGEGAQYYVMSSADEGAVPAYRFYHSSNQNHHYTIDENEKNTIIQTPEWGYTYEGVAFYVFVTNTPRSAYSFKAVSDSGNVSLSGVYDGFLVVPGDYNGDGAQDIALYEKATGNWRIRFAYESEMPDFQRLYGKSGVARAVQFGGPGFVPYAFDYDNDGVDDLAVYHEPTGLWYVISVDGTALLWGGPLPAR